MTIMDYIEQIDNSVLREKVKNLFQYLIDKKGWMKKPAGKKIHHAYKGGLDVHACEVVEFALKINEMVKDSYPKQDILLASILHDAGKPYTYLWKTDEKGKEVADSQRIVCSEEAMVFRLCAKYGIVLKPRVMSAIEMAHGGWSQQARNWRVSPSPLFAIIHSADMLSTYLGHGGIKDVMKEISKGEKKIE